MLLVPALRMVLGTLVAGGSALALGLGHGHWNVSGVRRGSQ
ncbi:hypothetical protein AB0H51_21730 [Streptomyces griseoluteus]